MSLEENKTIARRFVEEMMSGSYLDKIEEFVSPEALHHERGRSSSYRDMLRRAFSNSIRAPRFVIDDLIAEDDKVVVRCTAHATCTGTSFLGHPLTPGSRCAVQHVHIFRIRDGRIVDHWPVRDDLDALHQYGAPVYG